MLSTDQRLRANKDFRSVYARAKSYVHPLAVIYAVRRLPVTAADPKEALCTRVGFVVSKKQGCAVIRNRIKRRLRAAVRARSGVLTAAEPHDIVFVARKRLYTAKWSEVIEAVDDLLRRAGLACTALPDLQKIAMKQ